MSRTSQLVRLGEADRPVVTLTLDGEPIEARQGDTVLSAVLLRRRHLRRNDYDGTPRAGFCLMGACQDCWIWSEDGQRIRSCSTPVAPGMVLSTTSPFAHWEAL